MNSSNVLGTRIKNLRTQMGLSQEELAYRCNMQASHIGQIERGQKCPTLDTLEKLAMGFDITVSQLTDYTTEINVSQNEIINKINAYLYKLDTKRQKQVLNIIKTFFDDSD